MKIAMADVEVQDSTDDVVPVKPDLDKKDEDPKKNGDGEKIGGQGDRELAGTVAKHYNQLEEAGLEKRQTSRIFYLRNFNNWIKSVLIGDALNKVRRNTGSEKDIVVLDLCSGKGGDLLKWKKGKIARLVCADIAETSVEQSAKRYDDMLDRHRHESGRPPPMFQSQFIAADCTKVQLKEKYKDPSIKFDLVSCQFSFHYSFESYPQADMMLKNACECLKLGGYFVGTTPNSQELMKRFRSAEGNSFGNKVYRVTFESENKDNIPLFGAKYEFHLEDCVDCPEFLVYFPVLEKLAEKYGMKLLFKKPFQQFFEEKIERGDCRQLINKMNALECFPSAEGTALVGDKDKDYIDADSFHKGLLTNDSRPMDLKLKKPLKIGTMSQDEWEAATIYLVFMFQKVRDEDGNIWQDPEETSRKRAEPSDSTDKSSEPADKQAKPTE